MHSEWTDLLSAYLDDEMDPVTRRRLEGHLEQCPECRGVVTDLRRIVAVAPDYRGTEPTADLWPRVAGAIDRGRIVSLSTRRAGSGFRLRHLIAAGLVMAAGGAIGTWLLLRSPAQPAVVASNAPVDRQVIPTALTSAAYDTAVTALEKTLEANRSRLDTGTVRVVEESLKTIDRAIAEARAAIQRDSTNGYLNGQIAANLRKKVNLLRLATRAIASQT